MVFTNWFTELLFLQSLFQDANFEGTMNDTEKAAWVSFKNVSQNFLGNNRNSHLDHFPDNCGDYSEEQGERFHQDISEMESRYQGNWSVNMMADFCWMLKREVPKENRKRKRNPLRRSFEDKRVRYKRRKV
ncbi:uncharacterized protein LOC123260976 [Cotesia glomerata]|uniref:uncharacterized protein LOC123260976 n=1 Tax=Cotesia glomerata TaxID=32391 RepID=UPI001D002137|nr:uncharacterized protein LOC123260976 [Cotesia glomerata]